MAKSDKYLVIGVMSGTSLDGLDLAACEFTLRKGKWEYGLLAAHTISYPEEWSVRLAGAHRLDGYALTLLDREYGGFIGQEVRRFCREHRMDPVLVASHGHTVFHRPLERLTLQIGSGCSIAAETGYPVVSDFRAGDLALGGQGAPLVPIGDRMLFGEFGACLNLGGFANVSMESDGQRIAFDICAVNTVLNALSAENGMQYDRNGETARKGNLIATLLDSLNSLPYYKMQHPKSLGREWLETEIMPLMNKNEHTIPDLLRTYTEHIANQVNHSIGLSGSARTLVTGGGAHNIFLMEKIREGSRTEYFIPDRQLTDFKEALVFAFLGLLRWLKEVNILSSVTGASRDHSGGTVCLP